MPVRLCDQTLQKYDPQNYHSVVQDYGLEIVQEYMYHIRHNAEKSVRNLLRDVAKRAGSNILTAIDYLDDGSPVRSSVLYLNPRSLTAFPSRSSSESKLMKRRDPRC